MIVKIPKKSHSAPLENVEFIELSVYYDSDITVLKSAHQTLSDIAYRCGYRVVFEKF